MGPSMTSSDTNIEDLLKDPEIQKQIRLARLQKFREDPQYKPFQGWVDSQYRQSEAARTKTKKIWALNYAFYRGQHNLQLTQDDPTMGPYANRLAPLNRRNVKAINRIRPMVRTELAKLVSQKPSAYVVPASSEDQDLFAAYAGEQVWEHMYSHLDVQKIFSRAAFWTSIAGNGFIKTWWDSSKEYGQGDVGLAAPTPFNIFVADLMEPEIEDQAWIIHAYAKPIEWVKQHYAEELEGFEINPNSSTDQDFKGAIEGQFPTGSNNAESKPDTVTIKEMWLKPGTHALFPNGGMVTFVDTIAVEAYTDGMPYEHNQYPFIKFDHLYTDTFYCDSVISDIRDLQIAYNNIRAKIQESIRRSGLNTLVAPKGSVVGQKISNDIGQVIYFNPGLGAPQPLPPMQVPQHYFSELERILMDIEDISGQHQVSRGEAPPGVTAATAISFLQEQDDNYMTTTYQSVEVGMEKLAKQILTLCVQFWDEPRKISAAGDTNAFDIQLLSGADIRNGTDVRIEGGSALPQSRAARQALVMDLMQQGFIEPEKGMKMLEIGGAQRIMDELREDERQAQRENIKLKSLDEQDIEEFTQIWLEQAQIDPQDYSDAETGQALSPPPIVPVNTWDNHEIHIEVHNRFRKSQAFEHLPESVKTAFETHVEMHKQVMLQESLQEFMNMIPTDGTMDSSIDPMGADPDQLSAGEIGPLNPDQLMGGGGPPIGPVGGDSAAPEEYDGYID